MTQQRSSVKRQPLTGAALPDYHGAASPQPRPV